MKLYTRTGDDGTTALFGGRRVRKDALRVEAYGAVDEANAALGMARSQGLDGELDRVVADLQRDLFDVGADLATPHDAPARAALRPIEEVDVAALEALIDRFDAEVEPLRQFIVPGGHASSAALQFARAVCRRAERAGVALMAEEEVNALALRYLNRLSDLLFAMGRVANARHGVSEARFHVPRRIKAASEDG
jgi:cob(I)alamin adenosyltransferase